MCNGVCSLYINRRICIILSLTMVGSMTINFLIDIEEIITMCTIKCI